MRGRIGERHLMRAERAFNLQAVHPFRPRPAFRGFEDDHRPARAHGVAVDAGFVLNAFDLLHRLVQRRGHGFVHQRRLMSLDVIRRPAVAAQELVQFLRLDAREDSRVGDLVAVEVQDGQHGAVGDGIEKFIGLPRCRQRPGFRLAIADNAGDDEVGIVEHCPERMAERIA